MELQSQTLSEGFASYFYAKLCLLAPFGESRILCIFYKFKLNFTLFKTETSSKL